MTVRKIPALCLTGGSNEKPDNTGSDGVRKLTGRYAWEAKADRCLKDESLRLVIAPTGSGKSTLLRVFSYRDVSAGHKSILVVPQRIIGAGFQEVQILLPGRKKPITWAPGHDQTNGDGHSVQALIDFVRSPQPTKELNVFLCCHQTLVQAHQRLIAEYKGSGSPWVVAGSVALTIDETHHSQNYEDEKEEVLVQNKIGSVIRHWLDTEPGPLTLATATLLRADWLNIIPRNHRKRFATFVLSPEEYLATCFPKGFKVEIFFHVGEPEEAIRELFKRDPKKKTLLYLPHLMHPYVTELGGKFNVLDQLKLQLGTREGVDGVYETYRCGRSKMRVADFVTDESTLNPGVKNYAKRNGCQDYVLAAINEDGRVHRGEKRRRDLTIPDLILALDMCQEGFDFPALARSIVVGERGSIPQLLQMLGRLLRPYPGQMGVEFHIVIPYSPETVTPDEIRRYLNVMVGSLVIDWHFREAPPCSQTKLAKLLKAITDKAISAPSDSDAKDIIEDVVDSLGGTDEEKKELVTFTLRGLSSSSKRLLGLTEADQFDLQLVEHLFGCIRVYAGAFGCKNLGELREKLGRGPTLTKRFIAQQVVIHRCLHFKERGMGVDPLTIPGVRELFGPNAEEVLRGVGL